MGTAKRTAYVLTAGLTPARAQRTKKILTEIGFDVLVKQALNYKLEPCNGSKTLSHLLSFEQILKTALTEDKEWFYFFEDDISFVEDITIEEIIEYEKTTPTMFYLGCCCIGDTKTIFTEHIIGSHPVYRLNGNVYCLHAVGISKQGAELILAKLQEGNRNDPVDIIIKGFSKYYNIPCVRFDLSSPQIFSHKGICFQDRQTFETEVSNKKI